MNDDRRPRPYSKLDDDGRIVWVTPEERVSGKTKRSRLESDAEVRARLRAHLGWDVGKGVIGEKLDWTLAYYNIPKRRYVDE